MFRASQIFGDRAGFGKGRPSAPWEGSGPAWGGSKGSSGSSVQVDPWGSDSGGEAGGCAGAAAGCGKGGSKGKGDGGSASRPRSAVPRATTPSTICLQGPGLALSEREVDDACRRIAIEGGFSVHETIKIIHATLAYVEFPHPDAAAAFMRATNNSVKVGLKSFSVRRPLGREHVHREEPGDQESAGPEGGEPTNVLMIKGLPDVSERRLLVAFSQYAPRIRRTVVPKTFSGQSKNHAYVHFYEVHEATAALRHYRAAGSLIEGRPCAAEYVPPQNFLESLEVEASREKAEEHVKSSHQQALAGVNADMWASYLAMFEGSAEPASKRMKV